MKKEWVGIFVCLVCIGYLVGEAYAEDPPLIVDLNHIKFDYQSGSADDALDIRKNKNDDVTIPEWANSGQTNEKMAYIKSQTSRKVQADFTHNQDNVNSLHIRATVTTGTGIGNISSTQVNFPGGGPTSPYTTFTAGSVPSSVDTNSFKWKWEVTRVDGEVIEPLEIEVSGYHWHYTLLGTPQSPMSEPWTEVLDKSCSWASGQTQHVETMKKITEEAYNHFSSCKSYDSEYWHTNEETKTFYLTNFLGASHGDCRDMAAVVQVYSQAVGVTNAKVRRMHAEINGNWTKFDTQIIKPFGLGWDGDGWKFHFVAHRDSGYDTCIKLDQSAPYIAADKDMSKDSEYYEDLVSGDYDDWVLETLFQYENIQ